MKRLLQYTVCLVPALGVFGYLFKVGLNFAPLLTVAGLIYGFLGASLVLTSDLDLLKQVFIPTEKISQIESARDKLYKHEIVQDGEEGYDELIKFIKKEFNISNRPDCISTISSAGVIQTSAKVSVLGYIKKDGDFPDDILGEDGYRSDLVSEDYESIKITKLSLFDARLSQYLVEIERNAVQFPLRLGWILLILGFALQLSQSLLEFRIDTVLC
jgi:hypothetical protein